MVSWRRKWAKVARERRKQVGRVAGSLPSLSPQQWPKAIGHPWHRSLFVGEDHTVVIVVTVVDHTEVIVACQRRDATQPEISSLHQKYKITQKYENHCRF